MHKSLFFITTLVVCFASALPALADDELRMIPIFRHGTTFRSAADVVTADIDGDKVTEVVTCGVAGPIAIGARDGAFEVEWNGPTRGCSQLAVGDRDRDGSLEVIVVYQNQLMIFDSRSLSGPVASVTLPATGTDVAFGNVDSDAGREIVVTGASATWIYDAATLEVQWTASGYGGSSVRIADIDGSTLPEVVVNGSTAAVLDADAETQKWGYVGGFGSQWATGNVDGDAKEEIVFRSGSTMTILSGDTFTTVTWPISGDFYGLTVADGNADGVNDIVGAQYGGEVRGYRPSDGLQIWNIPVSTSYGVTSILFSNVDGDASLEVVLILSEDYYGGVVTIVDRDSATVEWRSPRNEGPYFLATGDLDGDGSLETVVSTMSFGYYYSPGQIEIFDAATHALKATIALPTNYSYDLTNLAIAQADADPALEIVAMVSNYPILLMTWDGVTHQQEFTSNTGSTSLLNILAVANIDGDALDELFVATGDEKVLVLNGASNFVQKTLQFPNDVRAVTLADLDGDSDLELIVGSYYDQIYVYDTTTWTLLGQASLPYMTSIKATSADGGTVAAISDSYGLRVFKGATLAPAYSCSASEYRAIAFGEIAGETRLVAANLEGALAIYPLDGEGDCPDPLPVATPAAMWISRLQFADATGDGRDDLLVSTQYGAHVALIGLSSELRGDCDGDEAVTVDDVDTLTDYLLANTPGIAPSADANADGRLGIEDLFQLIDHEFGSGAELQP